MQYYYFNLPKNKVLDREKNRTVSESIRRTARYAFEPFETYLRNAISALEKKENIKAKWKKVNAKNNAELRLIGKLFEIQSTKGLYKIISQVKDPDFSELIIYTVGTYKNKIAITQEDFNRKIIRLDIETLKFDRITWNGDDIELEPLWTASPPLSNGIIIDEQPDRLIVYSENGREPNSNAVEILRKKLNTFIDFENLKFENGQALSATKNDELNITLTSPNDFNKVVVANQLKFRIEHVQRNNKDAYWIQLQELDDNGNDDVPGFSPLKYFFDDGIEIEDDKKNKYHIAAGIESENKIVLKNKDRKFCFPEDNSTLTVKVNTYQLSKQIEAISTLLNMPIGEHSNLIKLFEDRTRCEWATPSNQQLNEWFVITDTTRSGCAEQRRFIHQAINTPDFAILEGPPGSGKTTVILELICQLAKQGKRVLLCGSTHVAIDNVLERLKEPRDGQSLLNKFHILPVRIGDEQRISDDIKEFQINNLIDTYSIPEKLLLEASNLVCGTTIGILQHPIFKKRKGKFDESKLAYYSSEPIVPEFDYLIIDESSKTTFQEFLVPALYAKKWILVGDVMQLSPFTEREEIVSNIRQLNISNDIQQAVFYLQKLKICMRNKHNKFVMPVDFNVLTAIQTELEFRETSDFNNKIICLIHRGNSQEYSNKLLLASTDLIIIESGLLEQYIHIIPESHAILRSQKWEESEHAFIHNIYQQKHSFQHKEHGREINNSFSLVASINTHFIEKSWAEEIAWRVDREHQIRLTQNSKLKGQYGRAIEDLIPKSLPKDTIEEQINSIASMAFPSILESLTKGISGRKTRIETTISEGFNPRDIASRKTILKYQHRMHPDISRFPRHKFYQSENALLDLESPEHIRDLRQWYYNEYLYRSVWIDVKGSTIKNKNHKEVSVLISQLKEFLDYAKYNAPPKGNKEWVAACLTFYRGQETLLREELQKLTRNENGYSNFRLTDGTTPVQIKLHTVDKFQGQEADIVFLSMVQTNRDGFLDNPNRLNVAITRAKFQLVIIGNHDYYSKGSKSEDLKELANNTFKQQEK